MNLIVDASVALKWFFREREDEDDVEPALALLAGIDTDHYRLWQPPHFLAEVAAVLAREKPDAALEDLADLRLIPWHTVDNQVFTTIKTEGLLLPPELIARVANLDP
ncbi:hypothetical protein Thiowin_02367 [Thiorhodovibrio winogradskyi]|uniref:PIN domain-containing protein n=1 Tax=Thiorhodovibrio winogradskyi TaxID=77007 RepID=A0ABZ0S8M5_9GAMM|nr:PIN domain-containing protein [Thiorhodovibrio winogradskyi]